MLKIEKMGKIDQDKGKKLTIRTREVGKNKVWNKMIKKGVEGSE